MNSIVREKVIAVVPAYNEAPTIHAIVINLQKEVDGVIVVDDGSSDGTGDLARQAGAHVVTQASNQGYDKALNLGFAEAIQQGATVIVTFDADNQHNPQDIQKIVRPILEGRADIVVGRRPWKQRSAEHLFALYSKFKIGIQDPLSGLKAYRSLVYKQLGHFDHLGSTGTELMFMASKKGNRLIEVEINCQRRKDTSRFGKNLSGNYKIFKSFLKVLFYT